ncbi:MAG TPA: hypothetical protein VEX13_07170, partial [Chloroflexia bacterium]|nr:hypothetical protein [Chloroflexia bacterium]
MQAYTSPSETNPSNEPDADDRKFALRTLAVSGILTLVGYVAFFLLLQSPSLWVAPTLLADRLPSVYAPLKDMVVKFLDGINNGGDYGVLNSRIYFGIMACLFIIYIITLVRLFKSRLAPRKSGKAALQVIMLFTALILALLLFLPGTFTTDLFAYAWYGYIFAVQGGNPYIDVPIKYAAIDTGSWLQYLFWKDQPNVYGPIWTLLAGGIAKVAQAGDNDLMNHLLGHRLLASAAHLVNVWLVWKVSELIARRYSPMRDGRENGRVNAQSGAEAAIDAGPGAYASWGPLAQVAATVTYAWNPLLLVEFGASGHNDVLVLTASLAAIWLHLAGKWRLAVLVLTVGMLIKMLPALFFLAAYVAYLFWQEHRIGSLPLLASRIARVAQAAIIVGVVWVVAWLPFLGPAKTIEVFTNSPGSKFYIHSIGTVIRYTIPDDVAVYAAQHSWQPPDRWTAYALGQRLDKPTRDTLFLLTAAIIASHLWRARNFRRTLVAMGWATMAYVLLGSTWFWPWYTSWLIVPLALAGPGRLYKAGLIMCMSSMVVYGVNPTASAGAFTRLWA